MKIFRRKINYIDLGIIAAILIIGAAAFFLLFRKSTYITVVVKVGSEHFSWTGGTTKSLFSQFFYKGMKQQDGFGRTLAEVSDLYSYDTSGDTKALYLTLRLRTVYNRASNQYTFNGKPVLVGSTLRLYLDKVLMDSLVTHIEGIEDRRVKKKLIVEAAIWEDNPVFAETNGVKPYLADVIKDGDEIKDDQGNVVIKVIKKNVSAAKRNIITSDGRLLSATDPNLKDVSYMLELTAVELLDHYFVFDDVPVVVGWGIPLNSSTYSVFPVITKIVSIE